jgi:hypothetical protein
MVCPPIPPSQRAHTEEPTISSSLSLGADQHEMGKLPASLGAGDPAINGNCRLQTGYETRPTPLIRKPTAETR